MVSMKNGPGWFWRRQMYFVRAATGHIGELFVPIITSAPMPNWSHLDFLRCILIIDGDDRLSTATSPQER